MLEGIKNRRVYSEISNEQGENTREKSVMGFGLGKRIHTKICFHLLAMLQTNTKYKRNTEKMGDTISCLFNVLSATLMKPLSTYFMSEILLAIYGIKYNNCASFIGE